MQIGEVNRTLTLQSKLLLLPEWINHYRLIICCFSFFETDKTDWHKKKTFLNIIQGHRQWFKYPFCFWNKIHFFLCFSCQSYHFSLRKEQQGYPPQPWSSSFMRSYCLLYTEEVLLLWYEKTCSDLAPAQVFYVRKQKEQSPKTIRGNKEPKIKQQSRDLVQQDFERSFLAGLFYSKQGITIICHSKVASSQSFLPAIGSEWKQNLLYLQ